jgi:Lipocalin-like domain
MIRELQGNSLMRPRVWALIIILTSCAGAAAFGGHQGTAAERLAGVWDLVSYEDHRPNGEVLYGWGQHPSGVLTYSPNGRMTVQFMREPRATFAAGRVWGRDNQQLLSNATTAEIRAAYVGYYAYFGTYDVDERARTVTHHITSSLRSHEVGADNVRSFELSGNQLRLRLTVVSDDGEERRRLIVWRRAE